MKNLIKHKVFISTFLLTYFLFFALTINLATPEITAGGAITAGVSNYGFPFTFYTSHCFGGNHFLPGLIGNIMFAAVFSFVGGIVAALFWIKFSSPEFRKKWYL